MEVPTHQHSDQLEECPDETCKHQHFRHDDYARLKFDAYWDDRSSPYGEIHKLTVFYYLCDNTIQIVEKPEHGRPFMFYKRLKLPKVIRKMFIFNSLTLCGLTISF